MCRAARNWTALMRVALGGRFGGGEKDVVRLRGAEKASARVSPCAMTYIIWYEMRHHNRRAYTNQCAAEAAGFEWVERGWWWFGVGAWLSECMPSMRMYVAGAAVGVSKGCRCLRFTGRGLCAVAFQIRCASASAGVDYIEGGFFSVCA